MKPETVVVILVNAEWAVRINAEAYLGEPKEHPSPPNAKAFAVQIEDATHQFGLLVRAIHGNQPEGNEIRLLVPWHSVEAIAWRPNMAKTANQFGF